MMGGREPTPFHTKKGGGGLWQGSGGDERQRVEVATYKETRLIRFMSYDYLWSIWENGGRICFAFVPHFTRLRFMICNIRAHLSFGTSIHGNTYIQ